MKSKKMIIPTLVLALMLAVVPCAQTLAWGPERPTYTMAAPAKKATFNSITDNAAVGDERDFVRVAEVDSGRAYTSELIIEPGKEYEVWIYFHNDASETFNDAAHDYAGVARDTRVISYFPKELAKGERGKIEGYITSTSTDPTTVWDEAYVTAKSALTISYVPGSAHFYNRWNANNTALSESLFTPNGEWLGVNELNGLVLGCDRFAGTVMYHVKTTAVEQPEEPTPEEPVVPEDPEVPEPTPEEPVEVVEELPVAGPAEVTLAVVVLLAIAAGGFYWYQTHRAVKKVTKCAKGRK